MIPIELPQGITLFPLSDSYCDHWAAQLGPGFNVSVSDRPGLNVEGVHRFMREIAREPLFAVIETNYFGGEGDQAAAVYRGVQEVMPPEQGEFGPINRALRCLGVQAPAGKDEFDTVELGRYRDFSDLFDSYRA